LDGIRAHVEAGFSEVSQGILVVCSRNLRNIRTDRGDEDRQAAKSDRLLAARRAPEFNPVMRSEMAGLPSVTDADFQQFISGQGLALVDFSATWCGPCKKLHPILEEIQRERDDLRIAVVDIQQAPDAARSCGVMSVPQVHFFKDGVKVEHFIGLQSKPKILELIDKHV
jgi:thioredoxin 1